MRPPTEQNDADASGSLDNSGMDESSSLSSSNREPPPSSPTTIIPSTTASASEEVTSEKEIKIIFSDLDGTLIHYPSKSSSSTTSTTTQSNNKRKKNLLEFPPSSTGLRGVISTKTMSLIHSIRHHTHSENNHNRTKFVLVSGMRTSTLLQRLPFLPKADAYCSENGGRIFYPVHDPNTIREGDDVFWVRPKKYKLQPTETKSVSLLAKEGVFEPFAIREDLEWRKSIAASMMLGSTNQPTTFSDSLFSSYGSFSLQQIADDPTASTVPLHDRDGLLWDFARDLLHHHGIVLDMKGYATCFRVNQNQQTEDSFGGGQKAAALDRLKDLLEEPPWADSSSGIASSVNLKCFDFYPSSSGKKNCCLYLVSKFFAGVPLSPEEETDQGRTTTTTPDRFLATHAVCLCDDDNDLEMALACSHAYLPEVSSETMEETVRGSPEHFTITATETHPGTDASDTALQLILDRIQQQQQPLADDRNQPHDEQGMKKPMEGPEDDTKYTATGS